MNEMNDWQKMQIRSAILLGLDVYAKRTAALREVGNDPSKLSQTEANTLALECASYAEAALQRLRSVLEYDGDSLAICINTYLAAETAAGRRVVIGYGSDNGFVNKTAAQFVADLKTAFAQRAIIRATR